MTVYIDKFGNEYWTDVISALEPRYATFTRPSDWLPGLRKQISLPERSREAEAEADLLSWTQTETWRAFTVKEERQP